MQREYKELSVANERLQIEAAKKKVAISRLEVKLKALHKKYHDTVRLNRRLQNTRSTATRIGN